MEALCEFPREKAYVGAMCDCCELNDVPVVTWSDYYGTTVCEDCYVAMREASSASLFPLTREYLTDLRREVENLIEGMPPERQDEYRATSKPHRALAEFDMLEARIEAAIHPLARLRARLSATLATETPMPTERRLTDDAIAALRGIEREAVDG